MSDVEKFYNAVAAKFGVQKKFSELTPMEINILCQGVSMILGVIREIEFFVEKLIENIELDMVFRDRGEKIKQALLRNGYLSYE